MRLVVLPFVLIAIVVGVLFVVGIALLVPLIPLLLIALCAWAAFKLLLAPAALLH